MRRSAARAVNVVAGFVDLPPQCLTLFRREPALASTFRLAAAGALAFRALLATRIGLARLLLLGRVAAGVVARVALLRHPVGGAC